MEKETKLDDNVRKIYVSDSPVLDDNIEYNYVNSDIEEELETDQNYVTANHQTPPMPQQVETEQESNIQPEIDIAPPPGLSEEDELAKEAEYQKHLQERLQNVKLNESSASNDLADQLKTSEHTDPDDDDLLDWKNPPANPFISQPLQGGVAERGYEDTSKTKGNQYHDVIAAQNDRSQVGYHDQSYKPSPRSIAPSDADQINSNALQLSNYDYSQFAREGQHNQLQYKAPSNQLYTKAKPENNHQYWQPSYPNKQLIADHQRVIDEDHSYDQFQQQTADNAAQPAAPISLLLQRNAPVMYMQNANNQNEYYVVTPRNAYHPHNIQLQTEQNSHQQIDNSDDDGTPRTIKAIVAPRPPRPTKNFVEKNKSRAKGQHSAKPGYSDRLVTKRVEQEQMKEWAPGMVIPRKKAASADDIIRASEREDLESTEDVWSKRSRELANAKQTKLNGKSKRTSNRSNPLVRYPSDNSITRKARVPPINPSRDTRGYLSNFQYAQGMTDTHGALNGYMKGQVDTKAVPPNLQAQQQHISPTVVYQPHISPQAIEIQNDIIPQYSPSHHSHIDSPPFAQLFGVNEAHINHGPSSGGYHHHSRYMDANQNPVYFIPSPGVHQNHQIYVQQPPPAHFLPIVGGPLANNPQDNHPAYDYRGYYADVTTYGKAESEYETESKPYEGSPYSSPHPPNYDTRSSNNADNKKVILNPYAAIPPIHPTKSSQSTKSSGSYVLAYQKEKEKAERLQKGPTYKAYTMRDYKNLKLEYKLGGLGPSQDPSLIKEKNDIRTKQLEYAKGAMEAEKKKPHPSPRKKSLEEEVQQISGRQLAVEYAKHIPKPKVPNRNNAAYQYNPPHGSPTNSTGKIAALQTLSQSPINRGVQSHPPSPTKSIESTWIKPSVEPLSQLDLQALEDLQRRHEDDQRAVAEIRYKMQQTA